MPTLTVTNFGGRLTRYNYGDINSGFAKFATTYGNDPFSSPGNLTWQEAAIQIDAAESVLTDLVLAGKERVESGVSYVYAIGHTGRLYKIQVNDPSSHDPNYDNPVLLATLTSGSPTFTRGASIDFFGATERIYIGHDKGVTRIDFDGNNETFVGSAVSWTQTVPRPFKQFIGNLVVGNGSNIAVIDSTGTVATYTKLSPGFPDNTQVRDMDASSDGNYLHIVVSRLALPDITSATQDTTFLSNAESYIFKWNGTDIGYTAYDTFPSFSLNANTMFGNYQYTFGYDLTGGVVFNPIEKILTPVITQAPLPNAVASNGNIVAWSVPEFYNGFLRFANFLYGSLDAEIGVGWWRQQAQPAQGSETDVIRVPFQLIVSNLVLGSSSNGYAGGVVGSGKVYFSALETSAAPTTKYKFYKYFPVATTVVPPVAGVYETQTQLFSKRVKPSEVRVYGKPWVANNVFTVALIGSDGMPIANSSKTFTAGTNINVGEDFAWYNPAIKPTYAIGIRITNSGMANHTINKVEIDYEESGR